MKEKILAIAGLSTIALLSAEVMSIPVLVVASVLILTRKDNNDERTITKL